MGGGARGRITAWTTGCGAGAGSLIHAVLQVQPTVRVSPRRCTVLGPWLLKPCKPCRRGVPRLCVEPAAAGESPRTALGYWQGVRAGSARLATVIAGQKYSCERQGESSTQCCWFSFGVSLTVGRSRCVAVANQFTVARRFIGGACAVSVQVWGTRGCIAAHRLWRGTHCMGCLPEGRKSTSKEALEDGERI